MVYDGIVISLIVGFIRRGSLRGLATLKFKWGWIFPLLLVLEIFVFIFESKLSFIGKYSNAFFIVVYIVGLAFVWMNRKEHKGFSWIFVGVFLNFLVMIVNGGRMPVSAHAAKVLDPYYIETLKTSLYGKHELLTSSTHLKFLGDIIPLTKPYPKEQVISIGDVVMNIGMYFFIQDLMLKKRGTVKKKGETSSSIKGGDINV